MQAVTARVEPHRTALSLPTMPLPVFVRVLEEPPPSWTEEPWPRIAGVRVEHKRFAVAVHYREVAPEHVSEISLRPHIDSVRVAACG